MIHYLWTLTTQINTAPLYGNLYVLVITFKINYNLVHTVLLILYSAALESNEKYVFSK